MDDADKRERVRPWLLGLGAAVIITVASWAGPIPTTPAREENVPCKSLPYATPLTCEVVAHRAVVGRVVPARSVRGVASVRARPLQASETSTRDIGTVQLTTP